MGKSLYAIKKFSKSFFVNPNLKYREKLHQHFSVLDEKVSKRLKNNENIWSSRPCVVCVGSKFNSLFTTKGGYSYVRCSTCTMVQMEPIPNEFMLDELYNSEEISYNASGSKLSEIVKPIGTKDMDFIVQVMRGGHHLDIGCGVGGFLLTMSKDFKTEGLEVNTIHANIGSKNGLKIHNMYSSDFYPNHKFDLISMLQVIEHLPNPKIVIEDVKRLLKPGGFFYVACPNFTSVSFKLFGKYHRHVSTFGHLNLFSPDTLTSILGNAGFELVKQDTYNLDVKLHDLIYFYLRRKRFTHRYSGYNPFTYALFELVGNPIMSLIEKCFVKGKDMGSYNRAIFKLKDNIRNN